MDPVVEATRRLSLSAGGDSHVPVSRKKSTPQSDTSAVHEAAARKKSSSSGGDAIPPKKPALTKAERREKQEAERAAKAAKQGASQGAKSAPMKPSAPTSGKPTTPAASQTGHSATSSSASKDRRDGGLPSRLELFSHLPVDSLKSSKSMDLPINGKLHPAVIRAGLWFNQDVVTSSNARCEVMLEAFKQLINSYEGAADKELRRDLELKLRPHIAYLTECRPMSVSMRNAVKFLKLTISNIDPTLPEEDAKQELIEEIDNFIRARIKLAVEEISKLARDRINDGDVIVTFTAPTAVETALRDAHSSGKRFNVVVLDTRPSNEGRALVKRLSDFGIACSYLQVNGAAYVMKEATKVFMGAHTFFANGHMMAPAGASIVAMVAKSCGVPVLVCCETYKFWAQRVQTDSFVFNELENPDKLTKGTILEKWRDHDKLNILNLAFDVTPPDFIDMVITEIGCIPCSSVPVIIREYDVYKTDDIA